MSGPLGGFFDSHCIVSRGVDCVNVNMWRSFGKSLTVINST